MANNQINNIVYTHPIDTEVNWEGSNRILALGEMAITTDGKIKIGTGVDVWRDLPFIPYVTNNTLTTLATKEYVDQAISNALGGGTFSVDENGVLNYNYEE